MPRQTSSGGNTNVNVTIEYQQLNKIFADSVYCGTGTIDNIITQAITLNGNDLSTQLNSITTDITALETEYEIINVDTQTLKTNVTALETLLNTAISNIEVVNSEINQLSTITDDLQTQIDEINTNTYGADITTLQGVVTGLSSDITTINSEITTIQGDIVLLQTKDNSLQLQIDELENNHATHANILTSHTALINSLQAGGANLTDASIYVCKTTDNIQTVINSITTGGIVQLVSGEYTVNYAITLKNNISIIGQGDHTILNVSTYNGTVFGGSNLNNIILRDFKIYSNSTSSSFKANPINFTGSPNNVLVQNIYFDFEKMADSTTTQPSVTIGGSTLDAALYQNIFFYGCYFDSCNLSFNGLFRDVQVSDNYFYQNQSHGTAYYLNIGLSPNTTEQPASQIEINSNYFECVTTTSGRYFFMQSNGTTTNYYSSIQFNFHDNVIRDSSPVNYMFIYTHNTTNDTNYNLDTKNHFIFKNNNITGFQYMFRETATNNGTGFLYRGIYEIIGNRFNHENFELFTGGSYAGNKNIDIDLIAYGNVYMKNPMFVNNGTGTFTINYKNFQDSNITTLQTQMTTANTNISTLQGQMTAANAELVNTDLRLDSHAFTLNTITTESIPEITTNITTLQSETTNLNNKVYDLEMVNIPTINTNISTLQGQMTTANSNISNLQSDLTVSDANINALISNLNFNTTNGIQNMNLLNAIVSLPSLLTCNNGVLLTTPIGPDTNRAKPITIQTGDGLSTASIKGGSGLLTIDTGISYRGSESVVSTNTEDGIKLNGVSLQGLYPGGGGVGMSEYSLMSLGSQNAEFIWLGNPLSITNIMGNLQMDEGSIYNLTISNDCNIKRHLTVKGNLTVLGTVSKSSGEIVKSTVLNLDINASATNDGIIFPNAAGYVNCALTNSYTDVMYIYYTPSKTNVKIRVNLQTNYILTNSTFSDYDTPTNTIGEAISGQIYQKIGTAADVLLMETFLWFIPTASVRRGTSDLFPVLFSFNFTETVGTGVLIKYKLNRTSGDMNIRFSNHMTNYSAKGICAFIDEIAI